MVSPKMCDVCGNPPLVIHEVLERRHIIACARKCVPDVAVYGVENAVQEWNKSIRARRVAA